MFSRLIGGTALISMKRLAGAMFGAATFVLATATAPTAAADGPFGGLAGSWSGGGTISTSGGSERLRCRVTYTLGDGGNSVNQNLRCASDSYQVQIVSNAAAQGSVLVGNWSEVTRGVSGQLTGRVSPGQVSASVAGPGFQAAISISTRGTSQTISIRVSGGDVQGVSLSLHKG
jgi:hypothetical protein